MSDARFRSLFLISVLAVVAADQYTKHLSREAADWVAGRTFAVLWPGVLELKLVYNKGVAFGLLEGLGALLAPIAIFVAGFAVYHSLRHPQESRVTHLTTLLLAGGALGNVIDRIWLGKVTDMVWVRAIDFPVFNLADAAITVAGFLLAWMMLRDIFVKEPPRPSGGEGAATDHLAEEPPRPSGGEGAGGEGRKA